MLCVYVRVLRAAVTCSKNHREPPNHPASRQIIAIYLGSYNHLIRGCRLSNRIMLLSLFVPHSKLKVGSEIAVLDRHISRMFSRKNYGNFDFYFNGINFSA